MYHENYYQPQQTYPRPRRRVWPWILAAFAVVALCGGAGLLMLGGTAAVIDEGVKAVEQEAVDRATDVKMTKCSRDKFGMVTVSYSVVNSAAAARSYMPQFDILSGTVVVGQAADITQEIAPGATLKGRALGTIAEATGKISCRLASA